MKMDEMIEFCAPYAVQAGKHKDTYAAQLPIPVIKAVMPGQARATAAEFLLLDSGVETGGAKDPAKIHEFVRRARGAAP